MADDIYLAAKFDPPTNQHWELALALAKRAERTGCKLVLAVVTDPETPRLIDADLVVRIFDYLIRSDTAFKGSQNPPIVAASFTSEELASIPEGQLNKPHDKGLAERLGLRSDWLWMHDLTNALKREFAIDVDESIQSSTSNRRLFFQLLKTELPVHKFDQVLDMLVTPIVRDIAVCARALALSHKGHAEKRAVQPSELSANKDRHYLVEAFRAATDYLLWEPSGAPPVAPPSSAPHLEVGLIKRPQRSWISRTLDYLFNTPTFW